MRRFAAIVVGGGPAGSAVALGLARAGHPVAMIERSRYQAWRIGESLPPAAIPVLDAMGVLDGIDPALRLPSRAIHRAWGTAELGVDDHLFNPHGAAWHVDRRRFDAWLAGAAEAAGATVVRGQRPRALHRTDAGWQLDLDGARLAASIVVDATGRAAWVARAAGGHWLAHDRLVGVAALLAPGPHADAASHLLLEAVEDGWWYSAPLPAGGLAAVFMTDQDALRDATGDALWRAQLARSAHTAARAASFGDRRGPVRIRSAASGRLDRAAGDGWLAVGDAASAYDPLSSDGIHKALRGGLEAAHRIIAWLGGDAGALAGHAADLARGFAGYLEQRAAYYHLEQRWPSSAFWRRRQPPDPRTLALALDPATRLAWQDTTADTLDLEGLLPRDGVARLCRLCGAGRPAHAVVAEFQRASTVDDRSVIVALGLLRDRGLLAAV